MINQLQLLNIIKLNQSDYLQKCVSLINSLVNVNISPDHEKKIKNKLSKLKCKFFKEYKTKYGYNYDNLINKEDWVHHEFVLPQDPSKLYEF